MRLAPPLAAAAVVVVAALLAPACAGDDEPAIVHVGGGGSAATTTTHDAGAEPDADAAPTCDDFAGAYRGEGACEFGPPLRVLQHLQRRKTPLQQRAPCLAQQPHRAAVRVRCAREQRVLFGEVSQRADGAIPLRLEVVERHPLRFARGFDQQPRHVEHALVVGGDGLARRVLLD